MTNRRTDDDSLDMLFASARETEAVDDAFLARLMSDANAETAKHAPRPAEHLAPARAPFWWRWLPASGLTAATLTGVWLGMVLPETDFGTLYLADFGQAESTVGDFLPSFGVGGLLEDNG